MSMCLEKANALDQIKNLSHKYFAVETASLTLCTKPVIDVNVSFIRNHFFDKSKNIFAMLGNIHMQSGLTKIQIVSNLVHCLDTFSR